MTRGYSWQLACLAVAVAVAVAVGCGGESSPASPVAPATPAVPGGAAQFTDADVSALTRATSGWTYYKNRLDTLPRTSGSGHAESRLRTRYNAIAATQLDVNGKVRAGANFPDSSLIVKELITGSTLSRYAVMMKLRASANSGGGWLWAYYAPDGATQISITSKGASCVACHSSGIDFTHMNASHP